MRKTPLLALLSALVLAVVAFSIFAFRPAAAAQGAAIDEIANAQDEAAWRFFAQAVAPSGRGPAPAFTTWASDRDTFRPGARWPLRAGGLDLRPSVLPRLGASARSPATAHAWNPALLHNVAVEEVRRNRAAFDYIVGNNLNARSGLVAAFGRPISFPVASMEVKTNWLPIDQVPTYYRNADGSPLTSRQVRELFFIADAAGGGQHALLSMHVISKAVPNWTWATFEHHLTPGRCDTIGCRDLYGATVALVPPRTQGGSNYGRCEHTPRLRSLLDRARVGDIFLNYCLKGSQTDFNDPTGLPIRLGNSVTEGGFVPSSSCMTCHGTAGWDSDGSSLPINTPIGAIDRQIFWAIGDTLFPSSPDLQRAQGLRRIATSADFVWSIPFCVYDDSDRTHPPVLNPQCFDPGDPGR